MPRGLWNQQWLGANSQRSYPLTEAATKQDQSQTITLPDDFLLAVYLPVSVNLVADPGKIFLRRLAVFGPGVNVAFAYDDGTADPPIVASAVVARSTHEEYNSYALSGQNDFIDSVGRIVVGSLAGLDALPAGQYTFDYDAGQLEVDCVQPLLDYVSSLRVFDGSALSERLAGDITLTPGDNVRITVVSSDAEGAEIRIDAIEGEGLTDACACETEATGPCIRTINGLGPGADGDIQILGDTCIEVQPIATGFKLVDTCSRSCCGCVELEQLTQELELFGASATTLSALANRLQAEVTKMNLVVLGSRLNDEGCDTDCP